jgi:hypothetical protein
LLKEKERQTTSTTTDKQQFHNVAAAHLSDNDDPNFDRKLDLITAGVRPFVKEHLLTKISSENCKTIVDYIVAFLTEVSPADTYRMDNIEKLKQLSEFHNSKAFKDMTRQDVIAPEVKCN